MIINVDIATGRATFSPSPLTYLITLPENFTLGKSVTVKEGEYQKVNDQGQKLYIGDIMRTETIRNVTGQDETLEVTPTPKMIDMQKKDVKGNLLYLEPLKDKKGNIIDHAEVTNSEDEDGTELEPVIVSVQEKSTIGKLVYLKDIVELSYEEVFDHVGETTDMTDEPIILDNMVNHYYTLAENPTEFTAEEIAEAKYEKLLEESMKDNLIADMFLSEDDIDLADINHSANTGTALLQLLPKGQARTKLIALELPSKSFELLEFEAEGVDIYLAGSKFISSKVELTSPVSNCTIKFINTTDKPIVIKSYAIGY